MVSMIQHPWSLLLNFHQQLMSATMSVVCSVGTSIPALLMMQLKYMVIMSLHSLMIVNGLTIVHCNKIVLVNL